MSNSKLRAKYLDRHAFTNGCEAQELNPAWKEYYNQYQPHSPLSYQIPAEYAAKASQASRPGRRYSIKATSTHRQWYIN